MSGVRVRGLVKTFRSVRRETRVLRGIDLDIEPGEVVGLIGPNGAGKTTLMSCLLAFLWPDEGEITIDGRPNDDLGVRRRTGFVPERVNFDRGVSGRAFVRYMARLAGVPRHDADRRIDELLARLGLDQAAQRKLSTYSRGMLQRIGLTQALVHEPAFLFLDEPTSGLDPNGVLLVRDLIREQKKRGAAVLLNSHQLAEVGKVCDRVLFLSGGVIARQETLRSEASIPVAITLLPGSYDEAALTTAIGVSPKEHVLIATVATEEDIAELVRNVVATGAGVLDVRRHAADLEQIFRGSA